MNFPVIDPVAIAIGPLEIRWYALAYLAGFLLGWGYALYLCGLDKDRQPDNAYIRKTVIEDFLPWAIVGVILGGRLGYVLFYQFETYLREPLEILKVWHGGMSFHGGMLGVIAATVIYAHFKKLPLLRLTDIAACAAPIGLFFGRIANFVNGELFGRPADVPWAFVFPRGGDMPRHPSQLYEAALEGLVLFVVLFVLARMNGIRNRPGILSGIFLAGYGISRFIVEFFREPDAQLGFIAGPFTMGQVLCAAMIAGGAMVLAFALRPLQKKPA